LNEEHPVQDTNQATTIRGSGVDGGVFRPMPLSRAAAAFGPMYAVPSQGQWTVGGTRPLTAVGWAVACSLTFSIGCAVGPTGRSADSLADDPYAIAPESSSARPTAVRGAATLDPTASTDAGVPASDQESLIDALASTYASDMAALSDMQRSQRGSGRRMSPPPVDFVDPDASLDDAWAASVASQPPNPVLASAWQPDPQRAPGDRGPKALIRAPSVTPSQKPPVGEEPATATPAAPSTSPAAPSAPATPATQPASAPPPQLPARTDPASSTIPAVPQPPAPTATAIPDAAAPVPAPVPASPLTTQVNGALELPPPPVTVPTEPGELAKLLAESLARRGGESAEPLRDWFAYAALAVGDPELKLPEDFGADLLPAERDRVVSAHAGFVALGIALRDGRREFDRSTSESLVLALTGGPMLEIPKVALCTKVEGFGRYSTVGTHRFLAQSNARFIVYAELDGFRSDLVGGSFTTRLATRVTLESERDGIEVWQRSPEWTAVVDTSPVRREEFFLCEIVSLSEFLTVGSYRLKVEIRDEMTGAVAVTTTPIHVVADPSLASAAQ
jgi:hypothetical protein